MIKKILSAVSAAALCFALFVPARAQYADHAAWGGTSSGTNTLTLSIANYDRNEPGVPIRFLPGNANTSSATINISGVGAVAIELKTPGGSGLQALTGGELNPAHIATVTYDSSVFELDNSNNPTNSVLGFNAPLNLSINPSVTSNNLTITLVGNNNSALSPTNPLFVAFRDATPANGDPVMRVLTAPLSLTIGSGSTMDCTNAVDCRLRLFLMDQNGTEALCAYNSLDGTNIVGINESNLYETGAGTSGGNSAQTLYCSTASTSTAYAVREIGYIEITESTAGTWATNASIAQLAGVGYLKAGAIVRTVIGTTATMFSGAGTTPSASHLTASIAPTSAANLVWAQATGSFGCYNTSTAVNCEAQIYRGTSTPFGSQMTAGLYATNSTYIAGGPPMGMDAPATTSSTAYTVYVWSLSNTSEYQFPWTVGQSNTALIRLDEIMSALDRPANDNVNPGAFSRVG